MRKWKEAGELALILGSLVLLVWALATYAPVEGTAQTDRPGEATTAPCVDSHSPMTATEWTPDIPWENPNWSKK